MHVQQTPQPIYASCTLDSKTLWYSVDAAGARRASPAQPCGFECTRPAGAGWGLSTPKGSSTPASRAPRLLVLCWPPKPHLRTLRRRALRAMVCGRLAPVCQHRVRAAGNRAVARALGATSPATRGCCLCSWAWGRAMPQSRNQTARPQCGRPTKFPTRSRVRRASVRSHEVHPRCCAGLSDALANCLHAFLPSGRCCAHAFIGVDRRVADQVDVPCRLWPHVWRGTRMTRSRPRREP